VTERAELISNTAMNAEDLEEGAEVFLLRIPTSVSAHVLHATHVQLPQARGVSSKIAGTEFEVHREDHACHQDMFVFGVRSGRVSAVTVTASYAVQLLLGTEQASEEDVDSALLDQPETPLLVGDITENPGVDSQKRKKKKKKKEEERSEGRKRKHQGSESPLPVLHSALADDEPNLPEGITNGHPHKRKRKFSKEKCKDRKHGQESPVVGIDDAKPCNDHVESSQSEPNPSHEPDEEEDRQRRKSKSRKTNEQKREHGKYRRRT
jgi:hypothetical protein